MVIIIFAVYYYLARLAPDQDRLFALIALILTICLLLYDAGAAFMRMPRG